MLGSTIILTAEPENIKAMLSTQFADYGKGEEFNKYTREFLGDSSSARSSSRTA